MNWVPLENVILDFVELVVSQVQILEIIKSVKCVKVDLSDLIVAQVQIDEVLEVILVIAENLKVITFKLIWQFVHVINFIVGQVKTGDFSRKTPWDRLEFKP